MEATDLRKEIAEIKKDKPIATFDRIERSHAFYTVTLENGSVVFKVPVVCMGDCVFNPSMDADNLIKWIYDFKPDELMKIVIKRNWGDDNQSLGMCTVINEEGKPVFNSVSLERGWNDNKRSISCIPVGTYDVVLEYSPKFKQDLYEIKGVPGRSECKFHAANYWFQLNGCIALGTSLRDINKDGYNDVTSSRKTMKRFHEALAGVKKLKLVVISD